MKEQLDIHTRKFSMVFNKIDNIQASLIKTRKILTPVSQEMTKLTKKLNDLEDRSMRNKMRLINLPMHAEGDNLRGYLQRMLPKWIPSLKDSPGAPLEIDSAHWMLSNSTSRAWPIIFRLLCHTNRQAIPEGMQKVRPTVPDGTQ